MGKEVFADEYFLRDWNEETPLCKGMFSIKAYK